MNIFKQHPENLTYEAMKLLTLSNVAIIDDVTGQGIESRNEFLKLVEGRVTWAYGALIHSGMGEDEAQHLLDDEFGFMLKNLKASDYADELAQIIPPHLTSPQQRRLDCVRIARMVKAQN